MTVTNDRRREVARNLREHGLFASLLPLDKYLAWMYDVLNCGRSVTSLTIRLADFIEPEPEPERMCSINADWYNGDLEHSVYRCSACGAVMLDDACYFDGSSDLDWFHYCPNCGGKVVDV